MRTIITLAVGIAIGAAATAVAQMPSIQADREGRVLCVIDKPQYDALVDRIRDLFDQHARGMVPQ
jgi:hypothetical protein